MRKTKTLAFILTIAMLVSTMLIPVDALISVGTSTTATAADADATSAVVLTDDVKAQLGKGFTQSTWAGEGEDKKVKIDGVKDTNDAYTDISHVSNNVGGWYSSMRDGSFDAWFTNDAEYLYVFMSVTAASTDYAETPTTRTALDKNDMARLYIDFYNQHDEKIYGEKGTYQTDIIDNNSTYNSGRFTYLPTNPTGSYSDKGATGTHIGTSGTDFAVTVSGLSYTVEARIPLPEFVTDEITAENPVVIGVGYEVRNNSTNPKYAYGYFDVSDYDELNLETDANYDEFAWIYQDYSLCADHVLATASSTPLTKDLTDETVAVIDEIETLNGAMDSGEGWAETPYTLLNDFFGGKMNAVAFDPFDPAEVAKVYISTDRENLYIFVDAPYALQRTYVFLSLEGSGINKDTAKATDGSDKFLYAICYGTEKGDGTQTWLRRNGGQNYSSEYAFGQTTCQYNSDKTAVEIKIPLSDDIVNQLCEGDVSFNSSIFVRQADSGTGYNGQFGSDAMTIDTSWCNYGGKITVPRIPTTTDLTVEGFQTRKNETNATHVDARFVATMENEYTEYDSIGFDFYYVQADKSASPACNYVYESIYVNGVETSAQTYGGKYFFCYTITDLAEGTYTFDVRCWSIKKGETTKVYSDIITRSFTVAADGTVTVNSTTT